MRRYRLKIEVVLDEVCWGESVEVAKEEEVLNPSGDSFEYRTMRPVARS